MADWGRAFRNDYIEPEALPEADQVVISECKLEKAAGFNTWFGCSRNGTFLGYVRVKLCGLSYCATSLQDRGQSAQYCGDASKLNSGDSKFSLAILGLMKLTANQQT